MSFSYFVTLLFGLVILMMITISQYVADEHHPNYYNDLNHIQRTKPNPDEHKPPLRGILVNPKPNHKLSTMHNRILANQVPSSPPPARKPPPGPKSPPQPRRLLLTTTRYLAAAAADDLNCNQPKSDPLQKPPVRPLHVEPLLLNQDPNPKLSKIHNHISVAMKAEIHNRILANSVPPSPPHRKPPAKSPK